MNLIEPVTIEVIREHLSRLGSGVRLDLESMPKPTDSYRGFRAVLEESDIERIFLWFEFRKHTKDGSAKLTDTLSESATHERIRRVIEGDPAKGWGPLDLRSAPGFEPVLLTNDPVCGPLCGIDGNHRMVGQFLSGRGFEGVYVYVWTHPKMLEWAYIPARARMWQVIV